MKAFMNIYKLNHKFHSQNNWNSIIYNFLNIIYHIIS